MKLLLFGGNFDPPHLGHMQLLQNAIEAVRPCKAVVMPTGLPPHKGAAVAPPHHRLQMCACFCKLSPLVEVSNWELCKEGKSHSLDTVQFLKMQHPKAQIYLSIGGDSLLQFHTWHRYKTLLSEAVLLVQSRCEPEENLRKAARCLEKEGAQILFCKGDTPSISSTQLRRALLQRENMAHFLPPLVAEIIREKGLYLQ